MGQGRESEADAPAQLSLTIIQFKRKSQLQTLSLEQTFPSPTAMGAWRIDRCGYTGSRSHKPTRRRLRLYGRLPSNRSSAGIRQSPERRSSPL